MRTKILLGTLVSFLGMLNAQNEVLTKVDGGASWLTGSGGIYSKKLTNEIGRAHV